MTIRGKLLFAVTGAALGATVSAASAEELTIATVNNADMIIMQKLSSQWEEETGNTIDWVVLEENVLRQRVTTDIATSGGQYDVMTIGSYETPIWGEQGWLTPLDDLGEDYDYEDLLPAMRKGLSHDGTLYAAPFYGESSFTMYRTDLFEEAGLEMPEQPTYDQIREFAAKLTDKSNELYGICLRGKPGWGENAAYFTTLVNTHGGRWFDMDWQPQLNTQPWKDAMDYYLDVMNNYGPPGASSNGYNENQALFQTGKCAMWIDATVAAGKLYDPEQSDVADVIGTTKAPVAVTPHGNAWFWSWALGIPASSEKQEVAKSFIKWATSKDYIRMVGESEGWLAVPPGTRTSTYEIPEYLEAAPFAPTVIETIKNADPSNPTQDPVPYTGIQYVAIPEFQGLGTSVGQMISAALTGQMSAEQALSSAQSLAEREMSRAGYGN